MPGTYIALPDPCPHVTRIEVIAARLSGAADALDRLYAHIDECRDSARNQ